MTSKGYPNEQPELVVETNEDLKDEAFDIPPHTELTIHIAGEGKGESYIEYTRSDGTVRRLVTVKSGGELRIRTARERIA